jgi:hypothetical protein
MGMLVIVVEQMGVAAVDFKKRSLCAASVFQWDSSPGPLRLIRSRDCERDGGGDTGAATRRSRPHPALLDCCFHGLSQPDT